MNVSIVVPTWAFDESRRKVCLASIDSFRHHSGNAELLVVDNGSERPLPDAAVRFENNVGYAKAVNWGLTHASGDWVGVGSSDIFATPGWLEPLLGVEVRCPVEVEEPAHKQKYRGDFYGPLWVMPREVVDTVGLIDPSYQNYCDRDYAIRIDQAGYPIIRVPESRVHHVEPHGSWADWDKKPEKAKFVAKYGVNGYGEWQRR